MFCSVFFIYLFIFYFFLFVFLFVFFVVFLFFYCCCFFVFFVCFFLVFFEKNTGRRKRIFLDFTIVMSFDLLCKRYKNKDGLTDLY